ncbi:hypothetical protein GGR56DRAFT_694971 [Xylariaceae sp. FL0804]|nr:hypothetical protein GGR56DRAFT_694971 [Xylariaceae sp. FL0804]
MRFSIPAALFAACSLASVTPEQICQTLDQFHEAASEMLPIASKVDLIDIVNLNEHKGALWEVVQGFHNATSLGAQVAQQLTGTAPIDDGDAAERVGQAYGGFADAHVLLFDTLNRHAGLFEYVPQRLRVGKPVVGALQSVDELIGAVSGFLLDTIKVNETTNAISAEFDEVHKALEKCKRKYEGFHCGC